MICQRTGIVVKSRLKQCACMLLMVCLLVLTVCLSLRIGATYLSICCSPDAKFWLRMPHLWLSLLVHQPLSLGCRTRNLYNLYVTLDLVCCDAPTLRFRNFNIIVVCAGSGLFIQTMQPRTIRKPMVHCGRSLGIVFELWSGLIA